jgi:hypothetical protein
MSAKHTPGPWTDEAVTQAQSELMRGPLPQDFLVVGADSTVIGVLYDYLNRTPVNARLIAAAPELLDLVRAYSGTVEPVTLAKLDKLAHALLARIDGEVTR